MRYASMRFSPREKIDLLKAWLATSLAFGIFFLQGRMSEATFLSFGLVVGLAAFTAGIGFIGHELMHKYAAHHFGVQGEFRSNDTMLLISILIAFLGVIFAAPGAVYMFGNITKRENGIISVAGPAANIVLAVLFGLLLFSSIPLLQLIGTTGFLINALLGVFNLIPFGDFDGVKVLAWHKGVYFSLLALGAVLVVLAFMVSS